MATQTGTADDYFDLLTQLRDFMTSFKSPSPWVTVRDTSASPIGAASPNTVEMIFQGDASDGGSPTRNLYFGIQTQEDSGAGRFNWELRGFTGFNDGSPSGSVTFENQPDASKATYVPLQNTAMDYWFWVNERRVIVVAKTGTSYQFMWAGFLNIFATELEYPYPMMVMGSSYKQTQRFSDNTLDYATGPHPGGDTTVNNALALAACYVRFVDGTWYSVKNFSGTSTESDKTSRIVYPLGPFPPGTGFLDPANVFSTDGFTFHSLYRANSAGGTPLASLAQTPGSPDDLTSLWPCSIVFIDPSAQLVGQIDALYWISAAGGVTAEDVITDKSVSPNQDYIVFQNVHRTDDWMFMAIKDE